MVQQIQKYYEYNTKNNIIACETFNTIGNDVKIMMGFTAGFLIYSFVKSSMFPETVMLVTYKAVSAYTRLNNAYTNLKTYLNFGKKNEENKNKEAVAGEDYTKYEIRIIKDGLKYGSCETMKIFEETNYLGNPNDFCESQDETDSDGSVGSVDSESSVQQQSESEELGENEGGDYLFLMNYHKENNTIDFIKYDFIMQTFFDPENKENKHYTKIYRVFTKSDYLKTKKDYTISNAGMIICSLELNGKTYDIDISYSYNFNVVGNVILDDKFISWYMMREHNVCLGEKCTYNLTCITKSVTTYKLGRTSALKVNLNEYEIVSIV